MIDAGVMALIDTYALRHSAPIAAQSEQRVSLVVVKF
jgi:hypothetical protein